MEYTIHTALTRMARIRYPVVQGAMAWITGPEVVACVSNAGALGTLAAATLSEDELRSAVGEIRKLTSRPFAVNIPIRLPTSGDAIRAVMEEGVQIVILSAGDPMPCATVLKDSGCKVLQVVFNCEMAVRAAEAGVDGLIAMGVEAGGNLCTDELTTMVLVPLVKDATGLPVVAAGGIADGRGLAAALALGADGVQIGTRILATKECTVHDAYKRAVLSASDTDTVITGRTTGLEFRVLRNDLATRILEMEKGGVNREQIDSMAIGGLKRAAIEGNTKEGSVMMGQVAGMIREERHIQDLLRDMVSEAIGYKCGLQDLIKNDDGHGRHRT